MRIEEWFARGLALAADEPAVIEAKRTWTFRDVDTLAQVWDTRLRLYSDGERPMVVGVLAGRDVVGYAGALAAFRSGATLVPLNPAFPPARNAMMLAMTGARVLLADEATSSGVIAQMVEGSEIDVVLVNAAHDVLAKPEVPVPTIPSKAQAEAAYVLFTSGSSGVPKGVPITHANVAAFLRAATRRYPLAPPDRMVQAYDMTFDLALASLLLAWSQGCPVVPASVFGLADPARLVARYGITVWASVPSVVELAASNGTLTPGSIPGLRLSMFCGEPLTVDSAEAWRRAAPHSVVENTYGPTEMTMFCTSHTWQRGLDFGPTVPIGVPFDGVDVLVVDDDGRVASTGELLLRGDQMFGGYLDPQNDVRAFLTLGDPHERWYRTGDLVRRAPEGLVHLGRVDDQMQVGGYRVEPGDVEHVLRATLGVTTAVVVQQGTSLVAFVHPEPRADEEVAGVEDHLPSYMCPRKIVVLDKVERNANGKLDRAYYAARASRLA